MGAASHPVLCDGSKLDDLDTYNHSVLEGHMGHCGGDVKDDVLNFMGVRSAVSCQLCIIGDIMYWTFLGFPTLNGRSVLSSC